MNERTLQNAACFKFKGGISIGPKWWLCLNLPWPFASIEINSERIVIRYFGIRQEFAREEIIRLELVRRFFITGLQVVHSAKSNPRFVLFSTLAAKRILAHAQYLGFEVKL